MAGRKETIKATIRRFIAPGKMAAANPVGFSGSAPDAEAIVAEYRRVDAQLLHLAVTDPLTAYRTIANLSMFSMARSGAQTEPTGLLRFSSSTWTS